MDELIESAGKFGKYQYKLIALIGLISALSSACIYATIFVAAEPELNCKTKNGTTNNLKPCEIWSNITSGMSLNTLVHFNRDYECQFDTTYYNNTIISDWRLICNRHYMASLTQTIHIFGSIFGFFGGIFGDRYGRKRSTIAFAFLLTFTLLFSQLLLSDLLFELSVVAKYAIYSASQFLIGLLVNCLYCTAYVLLMEYTTKEYRTIVANLNSYFYVLGELIVLAVYYVSRDWQTLNWFVAIYSLVLFLLVGMFLKESPAWLISLGKNEDAYFILKDIAKQNGIKDYQMPKLAEDDDSIEQQKNNDDESSTTRPLRPTTTTQQPLNHSVSCATNDSMAITDCYTFANNTNTSDKLQINRVIVKATATILQGTTNANNANKSGLCGILSDIKADIYMFKYLFMPKEYLIKTLLLFYIWTSLMLLYYGISLGVTSVDLVDPYLMYFLSSIAEIAGYVFCYVNDLFGRKKTTLGFLIATSIMYTIIAVMTGGGGGDINADNSTSTDNKFTTKALLLMIFALIGKCAVSGFYNLTYIYTSELYPIATRNTALLFLTCFGGWSSLIAPQINLLKSHVWNPLPYIVYSTCALLACLCVLYLPETRVKKKSNKTRKHHHHRNNRIKT